MAHKLDAGQKGLIRLVVKGADSSGWAKVSNQLLPVMKQVMPPELVEFSTSDAGHRVRLTDAGRSVVGAMAWLE